jgi:hypothetical protein
MTPLLEIFQQPDEKATIKLSPDEGEALRSLLVRESGMSFNRYLETVGLAPTNICNQLSGRNRMSLYVLGKLLAGTNLVIQCQLQVTIMNGVVVENVDCTPLDEMLYSPELDTLVEESTSMEQQSTSTPLFCSSVKHPEHKKTTADFPSKDQVEESFTPSGHLPQLPSTTPSPTQSDADQQQKTIEERPSTENPPSQKWRPVDLD